MYLTEPKLTMAVITGKLEGLNFIISDIFPIMEVNDRIRWIVAPKKNNIPQIISFKGYNPNYKIPTNNKGRPAFADKKVKHMNSLRTCISFYVRSLDPRRQEDHYYIIKLYITGSVNITGVTEIGFNPTIFNKFSIEAFKYFNKYINRILGGNYILKIRKDHFDNLNFKSELINGKKFNKNYIYTFFKNLIEKYNGTNEKCVKLFINNFISKGVYDFKILDNRNSIRIRYDKNKLVDYLDNINIERIYALAYLSSPFFSNLLIEKTNKRIFDLIINYLSKAEENFVYMTLPPGRSKGGVSVRFNIYNEERDRKINIYNCTYNTYVKNYDEAYAMHNVVKQYIEINKDIFIIDDEIKFNLV